MRTHPRPPVKSDEAVTLVHKGPFHGHEDEATYEFYSTEPGATVDETVWGKSPLEIIKNLQNLFQKREPPSLDDWGI